MSDHVHDWSPLIKIGEYGRMCRTCYDWIASPVQEPAKEGAPCGNVIEVCEKAGWHDPPCTCHRESGHGGYCMSEASVKAGPPREFL